jgi:GntR family transcriptional regulator
MLPSIRQLAREQKVSVITVQRGYELLEREGLILSRRGKGYFVNELQTREKKVLAEEQLKEGLIPLIKIAKEEGMSEEEIELVFKKVNKKQG